MQSNNKLPTFRAGDSLANQLTETTLTQLVEYVRSNTPTAGKGTRVRRTASGSIIEATEKAKSFPRFQWTSTGSIGSNTYAEVIIASAELSDGTPVAVDTADQDKEIGLVQGWVEGGEIHLLWRNFALTTANFNGNTVNIVAFP